MTIIPKNYSTEIKIKREICSMMYGKMVKSCPTGPICRYEKKNGENLMLTLMLCTFTIIVIGWRYFT